METFIEQKAKIRGQVMELEQENRLLQRRADDAELAIAENLKRLDELYQLFGEIGMPVKEV